MNQEKRNKHMVLEGRMDIQQGLKEGMTFKAISAQPEKNPSITSKEVRLHSHEHRNHFVTTDEVCPKLLKPPYVCNGYPHR